MAQTMEKSKDIKLSIGSIIKKMDKKTICFDHPLQRESDRWSGVMVGNLISDVLQGNPIPELVFAEQIVNGIPIIWNLDGKQRCTNLYMYYKGVQKHDKISRSVRRYMITYHTPVLDESGEIKTDNDGFPLYEKKEFDIRGKKFCQLPEELQERFLDYSFKIVQYINCTSEDIAYHILRYNEGKPANTQEKGIIKIGERYARLIKNIASLSLFEDNYTISDINTGFVNRVITESIMLYNFTDKYNGNYDKTCDYIRENATPDNFADFEEIINRMGECIDEDNISLMIKKNKKNAFLFTTLFAKFSDSGSKDAKFNDFLTAFRNGLDCKKIDGKSFVELMDDKSTKDKNIVIARIEHLIKLLCDYLNITEDVLCKKKRITDDDFENLAQEFVSDEVTYQSLMLISDSPYCSFDTETLLKMDDWLKQNGTQKLIDDCRFYKSIVTDCGISDEDENLPLYIYAIKYIDESNIDIDIDKWIAEFREKAFVEIGDNNNNMSNATIVMKQQEIRLNINQFITKEKENETI